MEIQNELQTTSNSYEDLQAISLQDFETFNLNVCTGFTFIIGSIGLLCGILLGSLFNGIFRN